MKRPYIFHFPCYGRSNGIRVMMILAEKLSAEGFEVLYHVKDKYNWPSDIPVLETIDSRLRRIAVAVYPEVTSGNPLRIRNVARLVLFYPGKNGGTRSYHKSEMLFTYRREFLPSADVLTIPWIDSTLFNDPGYDKTQDCCFVYKGGRWKDPPELRDLPTITMNWPKTREELATLLKHTKCLYSFDNASAVLDEATLCGVKVFVVTPGGYEEHQSDYASVTRDFPSQFRNFVNRTQTSDYRGPIQSRFLIRHWINAVWRIWIRPRLSSLFSRTPSKGDDGHT